MARFGTAIAVALATAALAAAGPGPAPARAQAVIRVRPDGSGDQPTIQAAIAAAAGGDTILLADGLYRGPGNRDLDFGGRSIVLRSERGDPRVCVIDCEGSPAEPRRGFWFHRNERPETVVSGITVRGGWSADRGGGVLVANESAFPGVGPTFANCVFTGNTAPRGAGLAVDDSVDEYSWGNTAVTLRQCEVTANEGSGLYLGRVGGLRLEGCAITDNRGHGVAYLDGVSWFAEIAVTGSEVSRNDRHGIYATVFEIDLRVDDSVLADNGKCGVFVEGTGGCRAIFKDSKFTGNKQHGGVTRGSSIHVELLTCLAADNKLDGFRIVQYDLVTISDSRFVRNGESGLMGEWHYSGPLRQPDAVVLGEIARCEFAHNGLDGAWLNGGSEYLPESYYDFIDCVAHHNGRHGIAMEDHCNLTGCTVVDNAKDGVRVGSWQNLRLDFQRTLVAFNGGAGVAVDVGATVIPVLAECDLFGNGGGDWVGAVAAQANDERGNFSADPSFCDRAAADYRLRASSPCQPLRTGSGQPVGALGVGCDGPRVVALAGTTRPLDCSSARPFAIRYLAGDDQEAWRSWRVRLRAEGALSFDPAEIVFLPLPGEPAASRQVGVNGPADVTVECSLTSPLEPGMTGSMDLFSVSLRPTGEGEGGLALVDAQVLGEGGAPLPVSLGSAYPLRVLCMPPPGATEVTARFSRDAISVHWSSPAPLAGAGVELWEARWNRLSGASAYPEYDDVPGGLPPRPADRAAVAANPRWRLVDVLPRGMTDHALPVCARCSGRGVYTYEVFLFDEAGNYSPPAGTTGRTITYLLGDVKSGIRWYAFDGVVDRLDLAALAQAYGAVPGDAAWNAECDVGPTDDGTGAGVPLTDDVLDFEDLMIFGVNYGQPPASPPPAYGPVHLAWVRPAPGRLALSLAEPHPGLIGLRVRASLAAGAATVVPGGAATDRPDSCFLQNIASRGLDAGLLLPGAALDDPGELLQVVLAPGVPEPAVDAFALEARDRANRPLAISLSYSTGVAVKDLPAAPRLAGARPNPFNPRASIAFELPTAGPARLTVYSLDGRRVAELARGELPAGRHEVVWDGRDARGEPVASGSYVCRLTAGGATDALRLTLIR